MKAARTPGQTQPYIGDPAADDYYEYDDYDDDLTPGQSHQYIGGLAAYDGELLRMFPENNVCLIVIGGRI